MAVSPIIGGRPVEGPADRFLAGAGYAECSATQMARIYRDVAATFADDVTAADLAALDIPIRLVVGERSPPTAGRIAAAIAKLAPRTEIVSLPGGTHAMAQTHAAPLAEMIEAFATA